MGHPTFMYRRGKDGAVEAQVFDSDAIPEGWADSPAKVDIKPAPAVEPRRSRKETRK